MTQKNSYLWNEGRALDIPLFSTDFFCSRLDVRVPLALRRFVREFRPQVVHAHGGRAGFFHALARTSVPTVYTVHSYHFLHKSPLARSLALRAERLTASSAQRIIFVSGHDMQVARVRRLLTYPERGVVIYNGVPLAEIPRAQPDVPRHVGFMGRLVEQKDPFLFLETIEHLPKYTATIVGGGALEAEVKAEIKRRGLARVRMLGALPHQATLKQLSKLGALVVTSRWEGLPMLVLEAMWSGVPVVAVNVGGLGEIIENGKSGILVNVRSGADLAQEVVRLDEDAALRARVVEESRNRVRQMFSEERMLREILKVYENTAAQ